MNVADECVHGGVKWAGLRLARSRGLNTPEMLLLESDDAAGEGDGARLPADPEAVGWIIRPSPAVHWHDAPAVSGLFESRVFEHRDEYEQALAGTLAGAETDESARAQLELAGYAKAALKYVLQPYLPARISGIAHILGPDFFRMAWTPGAMSSIAGGESTGFTLQGSLSGTYVVRGPAYQEDELGVCADAVRTVLDMLVLAARQDENLELEWLVTPNGRGSCLQVQPLPADRRRENSRCRK